MQGFNQAVQPGAKDWDFDINQFSITPERENAHHVADDAEGGSSDTTDVPVLK